MKRKLRLIITAFCISAILMGVFSLYSLKQFSSLVNYSSRVDHTNRVITQLYEIESLIKETDVKERGYIITHDSEYVRELYYYNDRIIPATDRLKELIQNDVEQLRILMDLRFSLLERRDIIRKNIIYLDTATSYSIRPYFLASKALRTKSLNELNAMRMREATVLKERFQDKEYYQQFTFRTLVILIVVFGVVTIFLFVHLLQELRKRMRYQDELQIRLADLSRSHDELEQIAHAVSHDLQEPVRKIQVFVDRLMHTDTTMDTGGRNTLERILHSANRMQGLVTDLVRLTTLLPEQKFEITDLNEIVPDACKDLEQKIKNCKAEIQIGELPQINGYSDHLLLLFRSLIDNSLKFSREGTDPVISITAELVQGTELDGTLQSQSFHRIAVADNGIGFDNQYISKIFQIFQRLHNQESEYAGKGIGLAMCQRIMVNHHGAIRGNGAVGEGATFYLFFPVNQ